MEIEEYMRQRRAIVERALDERLPPVTEQPTRLHEAMRYSVLAPGKRLRPVLVLASTEAVGGDPELALDAACAVECIHAFSLIHDDLPCMDNDDTRRGRPTNHVVFGEAMALLAGDALLALAFELIARTPPPVPAARVASAIRLLAEASGTRGMVGGQVADMEAEGREVDHPTLRAIHARKTGALLKASVLLGAILANADDPSIAALEAYGEHLGVAFQIADDILDVVGDEHIIGKPVGSDQRQNKATYPRLFGIEKSHALAIEEARKAAAALQPLGPEAEPLRQIARFVVERDR